MSYLTLDRVCKGYGQTVALADVQLEIAEGEIFFLLGPSGCGKTTLLRILAGLTYPDSGRVLLQGRDITRQAAHLRDCGMVFQNFALWPHLSVAENVAFGLQARKISGEEARSRVAESLRSVRMEGYGERSVRELSGGQQQRVALARALVLRPRFLLLDEPLSNLDAPLRAALRQEIRGLCKSAGLTAVYVTHDPAEALEAADRVGLIAEGKLQKVGSPRKLLAPA